MRYLEIHKMYALMIRFLFLRYFVLSFQENRFFHNLSEKNEHRSSLLVIIFVLHA
ncbi:MAG: hypothetical protein RIS29_3145 [Bacteroidota bacterium]|jgi:hypothetical protein